MMAGSFFVGAGLISEFAHLIYLYQTRKLKTRPKEEKNSMKIWYIMSIKYKQDLMFIVFMITAIWHKNVN